MSRVGKLPIHLDKSVKASVAGDMLKVEGPKGKLEFKLHPGFTAEIKDSEIVVKRPGDTSEERAIHGLMRKLIANMVEGVGKGFTRVLEINGVGYRAAVQGKMLNLQLGFSHEVHFPIPDGIKVTCEKPTAVSIVGSDRQQVGEMAAKVRSFRKPEPYKGKGIKYETETVRRKEGKKK